jgi:disulfide bond formation protein DsbB
MCDQVSWELLTISMAGWNALLSAALVLIWIAAARART